MQNIEQRPDAASSNVEALGSQAVELVAQLATSRDLALKSALQKRVAGVPTYTVAEAAALLGVSQDLMYRMVRADAFPALRMSVGKTQGRFVVPAVAVDRLLRLAVESGSCVDVADWASQWENLKGGDS